MVESDNHNPYQPPKLEEPGTYCGPNEIFVDGNKVIVRGGNQLTIRCVRCNGNVDRVRAESIASPHLRLAFCLLVIACALLAWRFWNIPTVAFGLSVVIGYLLDRAISSKLKIGYCLRHYLTAHAADVLLVSVLLLPVIRFVDAIPDALPQLTLVLVFLMALLSSKTIRVQRNQIGDLVVSNTGKPFLQSLPKTPILEKSNAE